MVDAVVSSVVKRLGDLLVEQITFLQEVRDEVESLKNQLEWMLCFLKDAEEKQDGDHRIRKWVSDISDAAYDAEDIVDKYILKVEEERISPKKTGLRSRFRKYSCMFNKQASLYAIGVEIKALKKRLDEIQRNQASFNIGSTNNSDAREGTSRSNERFKRLRRESPYEDDEHHVVGFEEDTAILKAELLKDVPTRHVISIVGMGGLGKTTLARKVYNTSRDQFACCAWISVSQDYNIQDLLRRIIKSFEQPTTNEDFEILEKMNEEDLQFHLRKLLGKQKYLVVIDDVWDGEAWAILGRALPSNNNKSRVIITTRNTAMAKSFGYSTYVHELRFLKEEESWELFCKKVFPNYDGLDGKTSQYPQRLEELARDMVSKCQGLPLAIVILGGLLSRKHPDEWPKVQGHIWRHVRDESAAHVKQLLALSFHDLPHHLKSCFLYMGSFPEDFEIEVEKLLHLWVAEGFIQPGEDALEEVAAEHLNELIDRNLIQIGERFWRRITSCRVHDLLRDFAIEKSKELNFLHTYDGNSDSSLSPKSRRLAFHGRFERFVSSDYSNLCLRTLVFFSLEREYAQTTQLEIVYSKLRLLRVLDLHGLLFNTPHAKGKAKLPDAIGNLIHLRYLGLRDTHIEELPPSIGNLRALQTLDAYSEGSSLVPVSLPDEICNAKQLRHLNGRFKWPFRVDNLRNLRTLNFVVVIDVMEFNPADLINLRELRVIANGERFTLDSIGRLTSLRTLYLQLDSDCSPSLQPLSHCQHLLQLKLWGYKGKLPTEMHKFLPNLKYLLLEGEDITEDPMPALEKLPNLTILDILNYCGVKLATATGGFPKLEYLTLIECEGMQALIVAEGGMPMLRGLRVPSSLFVSSRLRRSIITGNYSMWEYPGNNDWPY